jgi:hypothetical protein
MDVEDSRPVAIMPAAVTKSGITTKFRDFDEGATGVFRCARLPP